MIYDATIRPMALAALLDIKGNFDDVGPRLRRLGIDPPMSGHAASAGAVEVFHPGREHWLLRAPLEQEDALLFTLLEDPPLPGTLILALSDAYAFFDISGPQARQILAIASPLDTDPRVFPADGATITEAFGQKVLLIRSRTGFEMAVERSYAPMMTDYFRRINGAR